MQEFIVIQIGWQKIQCALLSTWTLWIRLSTNYSQVLKHPQRQNHLNLNNLNFGFFIIRQFCIQHIKLSDLKGLRFIIRPCVGSLLIWSLRSSLFDLVVIISHARWHAWDRIPKTEFKSAKSIKKSWIRPISHSTLKAFGPLVFDLSVIQSY